VVHRGARVLLVKRKFPPNEGRWALPGGLVELGETVEHAAVREVKEETGLDVVLEALLDVQTDIHGEPSSPEYHYVLVDYAAKPTKGKLRLNDESAEAGWFTESQVEGLVMSRGTREVLGIFFSRVYRPVQGPH
jgi:8-oxo-dGTP diphosphatase